MAGDYNTFSWIDNTGTNLLYTTTPTTTSNTANIPWVLYEPYTFPETPLISLGNNDINIEEKILPIEEIIEIPKKHLRKIYVR